MQTYLMRYAFRFLLIGGVMAMSLAIPEPLCAANTSYPYALAGPVPHLQDSVRLDSLKNEVKDLRREQELIIRNTTQTNEKIQLTLNILTYSFIGISAFVAMFAAWATYRQSIREERRESRLMEMQSKIVETDTVGARRVSDILQVVHSTLRSRLLAWEEQEKVIGELRGKLDNINRFIQVIEKAKNEWRKHLEAMAKNLAQISRHALRRPTETLRAYQQEFDMFKHQHPFESELSGRCLYVRGVTALLSNEPEKMESYFKQVIELPAESDEDQTDYPKRLANALYYLGLNHCNFGEFSHAVHYLERARELDLPKTEILTRLVMAEAYVMAGQYPEAQTVLDEIGKVLDDLERNQGKLLTHQLRFKGRALLIRANLVFLTKPQDWQQEMRRVAEDACDLNGRYYYAKLTLAQMEMAQGHDKQAQELFTQTYRLLKDSGDLQTGAEARIRILLNMVCALCCKHGEIDRELVDDYLNAAETLRQELPRIDIRTMTVFSPLSKKNETNETIGVHLELIKMGKVLVE